jgi:hypothetical protein
VPTANTLTWTGQVQGSVAEYVRQAVLVIVQVTLSPVRPPVSAARVHGPHQLLLLSGKIGLTSR